MTIFVVGFPKSGNTWLAKMLCQIFGATLVDDDPNQLEINNRIGHNNSKVRVVKSHFLPSQLLETYPDDYYRVFYIFRDYRDVSISAWFYFSGLKDNGFRLDEPYKETIINFEDPRTYRNKRTELKTFIHELSTTGLPNLPQFSTWHQHIDTWQKWSVDNDSIFYSLSYSALQLNTIEQLTNGISKVGIEGLISLPIKDAVENESFSKLKREYTEEKKYSNASFLRSGVVGDWKNYYTKQIANGISDSVKSKLIELDFEHDSLWEEKLLNEKLNPETVNEYLTYWKCYIKYRLGLN